MTNELLLVGQGDPETAQRIVEAFGERMGLVPEPVAGGVRYTLEGLEQQIKVVAGTLAEIDAGWTQHVALGYR
jgi:hypothetical protein